LSQRRRFSKLLVMSQSPTVVTIGTTTPFSSADTLRSAPFGDFDPAHPCLIPGLFAANILTTPLAIEAPVELTWKIMVDFDRYPEWNPINRFFRLDSHAAPGQTVTFGPRWGPYRNDALGEAEFTQHETLTIWEENRALAYGVIAWWLNAERVQYVAPLAANRCRYYTYERTSGVLSPLVRLLYGRRIFNGFTANGLALKKRAEEHHAASARL
jgi:hypothetical protein